MSLIGIVNNSATIEIDFPFFTGVAGVRDLGDGRLQVACPSARRAVMRGEGTIEGQRYVVEGLASAATVAGLVIMTVRPVGDEAGG